MAELQRAPLRRSLYRSSTLMGAERVPMMLVLLLSTTLIFTGLTIVTTLIGLAIGVVGVLGLRAATQLHPQITQVYARFVKYRSHYPARLRFPAPMPHKETIERSQDNAYD